MANVFRGDRLKQVREAAGLTQGELAERVGAGTNQIWRYEKGDSEPSAEVLASLATELGVTADWFLGLVGESKQTLSDDELSPRERRLLMAYRAGDYRELVRIAAQDAD